MQEDTVVSSSGPTQHEGEACRERVLTPLVAPQTCELLMTKVNSAGLSQSLVWEAEIERFAVA